MLDRIVPGLPSAHGDTFFLRGEFDGSSAGAPHRVSAYLYTERHQLNPRSWSAIQLVSFAVCMRRSPLLCIFLLLFLLLLDGSYKTRRIESHGAPTSSLLVACVHDQLWRFFWTNTSSRAGVHVWEDRGGYPSESLSTPLVVQNYNAWSPFSSLCSVLSVFCKPLFWPEGVRRRQMPDVLGSDEALRHVRIPRRTPASSRGSYYS